MSKSFAEQLDIWAKNTGQTVHDVVVDGITQISVSIVLKTPVGAPELWKSPPPPLYEPGKAKANWKASWGSPSHVVFDDRDVSGEYTIQNIYSVLSEPIVDTFYLVNSVPYIRRLEYAGWSTQAPQGMVRLAAAGWVKAINRAVAELSK